MPYKPKRILSIVLLFQMLVGIAVMTAPTSFAASEDGAAWEDYKGKIIAVEVGTIFDVVARDGHSQELSAL
jgi:hypothetical protein